MPLDFPTSPAVNEIYTFGGRSWIWNGIAWDGTISLIEAQSTYYTLRLALSERINIG